MNKFQRAIHQIAKYDMKKPYYNTYGHSYRQQRNAARWAFKRFSLEYIYDFKAWNKTIDV